MPRPRPEPENQDQLKLSGIAYQQHERGIHAVGPSRQPGIRTPAAHRRASGTTDTAARRATPVQDQNNLSGIALWRGERPVPAAAKSLLVRGLAHLETVDGVADEYLEAA